MLRWLMVLALILVSISAVAEEVAPLDPAMQSQLDSMPSDQAKLEFMQTKVAENPSDAVLQYHLGNFAFDTGQLDLARTAYEKAIEFDANFLAAYVNLGSVWDELGELDNALRAYERALQVDPNEPRALCNIGNVFFKKSRHEQAVQYFQRALAVDPKSQLAHYNLAIMFADAQIYAEAIVEWQAVVEIDPASNLGQRSSDNIEVIRQMMSAETPVLGDG